MRVVLHGTMHHARRPYLYDKNWRKPLLGSSRSSIISSWRCIRVFPSCVYSIASSISTRPLQDCSQGPGVPEDRRSSGGGGVLGAWGKGRRSGRGKELLW